MSNSGEVEAEATAVEQSPVTEMDTPATEVAAEQPAEVPKEEEKKPVKERKKREKTPKEKTNKPKAPVHPPYFQMIKEAITALNEKGGSSPHAIAKYMEQKHKAVLPDNFRKILGLQLKNSVSRGKLIKIKASYKLSEAGKKKDKATTTKAARANAGAKTKETTTKRRKPKSRAVSKIENPPPAVTRARRSKRTAKPKQLKSIRSPAAKKAKVAA